MSTYYIEAGEIDNKPAFLIVRADDAHVIGYQRTWHEAEEFMATKADPPGTELTMCADGWRYGLIAPGDRHPESWSKAFASHEECLRYARECASVPPTGVYSAWVSDSEGNRLYTTSGHATRQEALEQAWKRYPSARTVASGKGVYGWEDVQFQSAVARRIETGAPEPTGEAWDGSEIEQSWEMTLEAAERNSGQAFAAVAAVHDFDPALYGLPQDSEIGPEVYPEPEPARGWSEPSPDGVLIRSGLLTDPPTGWDVAEPGPEQGARS